MEGLLPPTSVFLLAVVRDTKKRISRDISESKKDREVGKEGRRGIPGACRRAVLLPNYSKHSAIGASIKRTSLPPSSTYSRSSSVFLSSLLFFSAAVS